MSYPITVPDTLMHATVGKKAFDFEIYAGDVIEGQSWNETHISSSGGGGMYCGGGVYTSIPVSVQSSTSSHSKFWIHEPDGSESSYTLNNLDFHYRSGHEVYVVYGSARSSKTRWVVAVYNNTTKRGCLVPANIKMAAKSTFLFQSSRMSWAIGWALVFLVPLVMVPAAVIVLPIRFIGTLRRTGQVKRNLEKIIEQFNSQQSIIAHQPQENVMQVGMAQGVVAAA